MNTLIDHLTITGNVDGVRIYYSNGKGLSAGNYARITIATTATTTRDLADMVAKGALIP